MFRRVIAAFVAATLIQGADTSPATIRLDPSTFDTSIRPQDDLFRHVNGQWLARVQIPAEKVSYGTLAELGDRVDEQLRVIVEEVAGGANRRRGSIAQQVGDLYASMMDEARIEALGVKPISDQLEKIYLARDASAFAAECGRLSALGGGGPFEGNADADASTGELLVRLSQSGILLPDRDYYLSADPKYATFRQQYLDYLTRIFSLVGRAEARQEGESVLALETEIARAQWTQADARDQLKTANRIAFADLGRSFPGFDWRAWAAPQGIDRVRMVVVAQPSFFKRFAELVASTPLTAWKAWLAARYITWASPFISQAFSDARFEFFGRMLSGQEIPRERWRRAVSLVSGYMGDSVGRLYVDKHFPASSKDRAERLIGSVLEAFKPAIDESDWMSPETKKRAARKLARVTVRIGYPAAWRDYNGLDVRRDDLFGNILRARQFDSRQRLEAALGTTQRDRWLVTPQTVNAYYAPATNELIVTAAMLQPPLFDPLADDAVNFGAIGAIVGHELAHGFDDRGRFFDADGSVREWWNPADAQAFGRRAAALVEQFNAYSPAPGLRVNGQLTLSENIGDLAGLSIAWRAYKTSLRGQAAPVVDGIRGEQRFFLSWALAWRGRLRDEYMRQWLFSTPHAPSEYRVNGPASNLDGFYEAFEVKPGDRLYRDPQRRLKIW
jgi:putative endopeptidase